MHIWLLTLFFNLQATDCVVLLTPDITLWWINKALPQPWGAELLSSSSGSDSNSTYRHTSIVAVACSPTVTYSVATVAPLSCSGKLIFGSEAWRAIVRMSPPTPAKNTQLYCKHWEICVLVINNLIAPLARTWRIDVCVTESITQQHVESPEFMCGTFETQFLYLFLHFCGSPLYFFSQVTSSLLLLYFRATWNCCWEFSCFSLAVWLYL